MVSYVAKPGEGEDMAHASAQLSSPQGIAMYSRPAVPAATSVVDICMKPRSAAAAANATNGKGDPLPLVSLFLSFRDEGDRNAYQAHKELEDTSLVCTLMGLALVARLVTILAREFWRFGTREEAPIGLFFYGVLGLSLCRYRSWASGSGNRQMHVYRSSVLLEGALIGAGIWAVIAPVKADPTLLLCVYGTLGWVTCGAVSPTPRMAAYLLLYFVNIALESTRPVGLRHAVFHAPVLIGYTIYTAEGRGRMAFVLQRHLWRTESERDHHAHAAAPPSAAQTPDSPRSAEV